MSDSTDMSLADLRQNLIEKQSQLVMEIRKVEREAEEKTAKLEKSLIIVEKLLNTLDSQFDPTSDGGDQRSPFQGLLLISRLSSKSLEDALVHLAEKNSGILNSYQARPVLVEAGLLKGSPGATSSRLYDALSSSQYFEPLEGKKGRWRLVTHNIDDDGSLI